MKGMHGFTRVKKIIIKYLSPSTTVSAEEDSSEESDRTGKMPSQREKEKMVR